MESDGLDRLMVHAVMNFRQVSQSQLIKFLRKATDVSGIKRSLSDQIERTESTLKTVGLALRKARDNETGEWTYVLVSTSKGLGERTRDLPPSAGVVIQEILAKIYEDDRLQGASRTELNGVSNKETLNQVLGYLKKARWLEEDDHGTYKPSLRLFLELEPYLVEQYGDRTLFKCLGCKEWLLKGDLCTNTHCQARLHTYCYASYFNSKDQPLGTCTECGSLFPSAEHPAEYEEQTIRDSPFPSDVSVSR